MNHNQLNIFNFKIKKFLVIIFSFQLSVLGIIGLNLFGFNFPIVREIITLIYLLIIPGLLIIRIIKIDKSFLELGLYTIGLSIATLMFTGLTINFVYPFFKIKPISLIPLMITISAIILLLSLIAYLTERKIKNKVHNLNYKNLTYSISPPLIFLVLLPFLSILGTFLVNFHNNNILLLALILIIGIIPFLVCFNKFIPKKMFPLAVFMISLSLVYHTTLISQFIWGIDIHGEYNAAYLVLQNGVWNLNAFNAFSSVASINIIAPIISIFSNLSLEWVFKILYPTLFALIPLALYYFFKEQTNEKIAFLSCYLFIALFVFYNELVTIGRQEIAELFLILILMLIFTKEINQFKKNILIIIFTFSLIISHYGISYIYMTIFLFVFVLQSLIKKISIERSGRDFYLNNNKISLTFILLFIIITISWYIFISKSYNFNIAIKVLNHIFINLNTEFLSPESVQGIELITQKSSTLHNISKYIHILLQSFIGIGLIKIIIYPGKLKIKSEYKLFSILNFLLLIIAITVPYFAESFNTSRLYHIALIFLAPVCIIGSLSVLTILNNALKIRIKNKKGIIAIILSIFLLFNTGFIYEITNDSPNSIALSQNSIKNENIENKAAFYSVLNTFEQDIFSVNWLNKNVNSKREIYVDYITLHPLISHGKNISTSFKPISNNFTNKQSFIFLGHANIINGLIVIPIKGDYPVYKLADNPLLNNSNLLYSNGAGKIYWT